MPRFSRWLVALASVAVLGVFVFPLWRVTLEAPQYPEGIGMLIHVDGVTGVSEYDLNNINGLNHYIGMARIEPDAIPELRFMPWIAIAIVVSGLFVAWRGARGLYITWAIAVIATLCLGVYDFWRWEYNYGHNLNPDAAIKIPGMAYQPPLFGRKQILNFVATSFPDTGGWMLIAAAVVIGGVLFYLLIRGRTPTAGVVSAAHPLMQSAALIAVTAQLTSCAPDAPRALVMGTDECAQCRMMITDARFGGEVITRTGKVLTFDAVECLSDYVASSDTTALRGVWVSDFEHPGTWVNAAEAVFIIGVTLSTPMGRSLLALQAGSAPDAAVRRYGGRVTTWQELLQTHSPAESARTVSAADANRR